MPLLDPIFAGMQGPLASRACSVAENRLASTERAHRILLMLESVPDQASQSALLALSHALFERVAEELQTERQTWIRHLVASVLNREKISDF